MKLKHTAVYINLRLYLVPVAVADELKNLRALRDMAVRVVKQAEKLIRTEKKK